MNYGINQPFMFPNNNMTPFSNQPVNNIIKVTGIDGAKAYQIPSNSSVALFDSNEDIVYIKTTDSAGYPTLRAFRVTLMEIEDNYVTRKEFNELKEIMANVEQYIRETTPNTNDTTDSK